MHKILITGANGFVGSHVVQVFSQHYQVIGLVMDTPPISSSRVKYYSTDIRRLRDLYEPINRYQPEMILHLAAEARSWVKQPRPLFQTNLGGTLNLYQAVVKAKKQTNGKYTPKIIYVSSAEVYGHTSHSERITEEAPLLPVNFYATSKVAADRLSFQCSQSHELKITIIRPFNHTGPGQRQGFFVPDMAAQIVQLEKAGGTGVIKVGNLSAIRDYLDVRDVAKAYLSTFTTDLPPGETFNLSSGRGVRVGEILRKMLSLSTCQINQQVDPTRLRPVDVPIFVGNSAKFRSATGWQSQIPLDQTLQDVLDDWRNKELITKNT